MEEFPRKKFASRSTLYFNKGIKQAEKDGNSTLLQLGTLMKYETMIYTDKSNKVIKQLVDKGELEEMEIANKAFGHYLLYAAYALEGDNKKSEAQLANYQSIKEQVQSIHQSNLGTFLAKNTK
jgi:polyhydroxyalkanoate synthesis regulator phasin